MEFQDVTAAWRYTHDHPVEKKLGYVRTWETRDDGKVELIDRKEGKDVV